VTTTALSAAPTITAIRHWLVHIPFTAPIVWGSGSRSGPTRLVVEITTSGGIRGYGETICLLDSIEPVLVNVVMPLAIGKGIDQAENLTRHVLGAGYYHHKRAAVMALCAVEMAMWDALGKHANQPLHRLWGGAYRTEIDFAAYLFINDPAKLADVAQEFAGRGYRSFKLKIGVDEKSDIALTRAVRTRSATMRRSASTSTAPGRSAPQSASARSWPSSTWRTSSSRWTRRPRRTCRTPQQPIDPDRARRERLHAGRRRQHRPDGRRRRDPARPARIRRAVVVHQVRGRRRVGRHPGHLHSGGELGLSQAAYLHLAASIPNMSISIDTERDYLGDDVIADRSGSTDGRLNVPTGPGLGVEVDLGQLERYRVDRIRGAYLDPKRPGWFPEKPAY
jgi:glucarate dehydratase